MNIAGLTALASASGAPVGPAATTGTAPTQRLDFATWLDRQASALDAQLGTAEQSLTQLASGESSNLHRVMLDLEQARLSFQLAVQVRNKLLEGYQELMRMQI